MWHFGPGTLTHYLALLLDPRYENIKYKVLSEEKVANALAFFKTYVIQLKLATNETEYD